MKLSDADLLDIVRRMRTYMATVDNIHSVLNIAQDVDDPVIVKQIQTLLVDIPPINLKVAQVLRAIEACRPYRDMIKKFNIKEEDEDDGDVRE